MLKMTTVVLLMITHVLHHCSGSQKIKIKQLTYPVEFGGNATFQCIGNQSSLIGRCTWKRNSILIVRDRTALDPSKYIPTLHVNDTGIYYKLIITNFNSSDVNCRYRCDIDFNSVETFLSLNEDDFIGKPEVINWNINETTCHSLSVSIIIEQVYPRPTCELFNEAINLTRFLNTSYQRDGYFYRTKLDIHNLPCDNKCRDEINISCLVGEQKYYIMKQELNRCEGIEDFNLRHIAMSVTIILVFGLVILAWTVFRRFNSRRRLNSDPIADPLGKEILTLSNEF